METRKLYPRRRNVAAQMAEELKTVTCATRPMEERRKKEKEKEKLSGRNRRQLVFVDSLRHCGLTHDGCFRFLEVT